MTDYAPGAALPGYVHIYSGKVRDLYAPLDPDTGEAREDQLLLVASDRISAYDFVLDSVIPDKGRVLTQMSLWWFEQLADIIPNHVISTDVPAEVAGRAVLVQRLEMVPVECIGRAYLTGSGLAEYEQVGSATSTCSSCRTSTSRRMCSSPRSVTSCARRSPRSTGMWRCWRTVTRATCRASSRGWST